MAVHMSNTTTDLEWTSEEDGLLFSLLHYSRTGQRSETRRPWRDIAVDMNAEAIRLSMATRFFHHENVEARWWLKHGRFFPVTSPTSTSEGPTQASRNAAAGATGTAPTAAAAVVEAVAEAETNLAALQDILARVGVESLNGQPLPPPARRGFQLLPGRASWRRGAVSSEAGGAASSSLPRTVSPAGPAEAETVETETVEEEAAALVAQTPPLGMVNGVCNGVRAESLVNGVVGEEEETGGGSSGSLEGGTTVLGADAEGNNNRVGRDPTRSWLF